MAEQPEIPGLPEAPETPAALVWVRWAFHKALGDPAMLRQNWRAILLASIIFSLFALKINAWLYEGKINSLEGAESTKEATVQNQAATIQGQSNTIAQLQEELKGTSPQLAAIQAGRDAIRRQLQDFYLEASEMITRPFGDKESTDKLIVDASNWGRRVSVWAEKNMGKPAEARIFEIGLSPSMSWPACKTQECNNTRHWLLTVRQNIGNLIETAAWDGVPAKSDH